MARRKKYISETTSLDSLMDALTNVVALLILVLVLVQTDISQKVNNLMEDLKPVSNEDIAGIKSLIQEKQAALTAKGLLLNAKAPSAEEVEKERQQLTLLKEAIDQKQETLAKRETLKKATEDAIEKRTLAQAETSKLRQELNGLNATLNTLPPLGPIAATRVTIPQEYKFPHSAKRYHVAVYKDRFDIVTYEEIQENAAKILKENYEELNYKRWVWKTT